MRMELTEVMEWLMTKGFVVIHKDKPKFTALFHKAYNGIEKGLTAQGTVIEPGLPTLAVATVAPQPPVPAKFSVYKYEDWVALYMQFIVDAKVPRRLLSGRGEPYSTNKYSEDGMKAFQKALKAGAKYDILVKSVILYYKSGGSFKKAIGNYMAQGDWRTDYMQLLESAQQGAEELNKHIKQELKTEHNAYRIG